MVGFCLVFLSFVFSFFNPFWRFYVYFSFVQTGVCVCVWMGIGVGDGNVLALLSGVGCSVLYCIILLGFYDQYCTHVLNPGFFLNAYMGSTHRWVALSLASHC